LTFLRFHLDQSRLHGSSKDQYRWRQQTPLLSQLLHWLTDDDWSVEFSQLQSGAGVVRSHGLARRERRTVA